MSKPIRLSEQWYKRGLWLVAIVFANFLMSFGGAVMKYAPKIETPVSVEQFMDAERVATLRGVIAQGGDNLRNVQDNLDHAKLQHQAAQADAKTASEELKAWLANRQVTADPMKNGEVQLRTDKVEGLFEAEREALSVVERLQKELLTTRQATRNAADELQQIERAAHEELDAARRSQELRIFGYRLALTLPLLVLAGALFVKARHGQYWPFVWGFIFFAAAMFFVELVPYTPDYGGIVRYIVGILVTAIAGRYLIKSLNAYIARQKAVESMSDDQRRQDMDYEAALAHLAKGVCPGCERPANLKDENHNHCPHCGLGLFNKCPTCMTRKSTFQRFCHCCGAPAIAATQGAEETQ